MDQAYCDALRFAYEYEKKGEKHYREAAEAATGRGNVPVAGQALQVTQAFSKVYGGMASQNAVEFGSKWNWLGNVGV